MYDFSEKKTYGPIEAGVYELTIETAAFGQTDSGINYISLIYLVRNDVDQPGQGSTIRDTIWENEVYVNKATGRTISKQKYDNLSANQKADYDSDMQYSDYKIRPLIQAQDADENSPEYKTSFESMDEVVMFLNGLNVRAAVKVEPDKENNPRNAIDYRTITRTEFSNFDDLPF